MEPRIDEYARNEIYHLDWVELADILDDTDFGSEIARELTEHGHDDEPAHDEMWDWADWIAESERQFLANTCTWIPVTKRTPGDGRGVIVLLKMPVGQVAGFGVFRDGAWNTGFTDKEAPVTHWLDIYRAWQATFLRELDPHDYAGMAEVVARAEQWRSLPR